MAQEEKTVLMDVYERLGGIDAKLDNINQIRITAQAAETKADNAEAAAERAIESVKSAHHRIDRIDKIVFWVGTTVVGTVLLSLVSLVIK